MHIYWNNQITYQPSHGPKLLMVVGSYVVHGVKWYNSEQIWKWKNKNEMKKVGLRKKIRKMTEMGK